MDLRWLAAPVLVLLGLSGCGSSEPDPATTEADCALQLRLDGVVYTEYGYTTRAGTPYREAEQASCDDVGPDARGSVFDGDQANVDTVRFAGHPPEQVVGVRFDDDTYGVYTADSLSEADRDRIHRELGDDPR